MNSRWIKILALVLMTIDHVGVVLFPSVEWLRIIGRLSYPLFAFLIAYGCTKTRNISRYFLRLILFAVWLQIAWSVIGFIDSSFVALNNNIFFTLAFGVLAIWIAKSLYNKAIINTVADKVVVGVISAMMAVLVCLAGGALGVDYSIGGILLIVLFWAVLEAQKLCKKNKVVAMVVRNVGVVAALLVFNIAMMLLFGWGIQWWSMLSAVLLFFFIDKKIQIGWFEKYAFYLYYPLHFVVLSIIGFLL